MVIPLADLVNGGTPQVRWIGIAVIAMLAVAVVLIFTVRWLCRRHHDPGQNPGELFTLERLRQMHRQGDISDGEFEILKNKIIHESRR